MTYDPKSPHDPATCPACRKTRLAMSQSADQVRARLRDDTPKLLNLCRVLGSRAMNHALRELVAEADAARVLAKAALDASRDASDPKLIDTTIAMLKLDLAIYGMNVLYVTQETQVNPDVCGGDA